MLQDGEAHAALQSLEPASAAFSKYWKHAPAILSSLVIESAF
jgi:hypothetical protein